MSIRFDPGPKSLRQCSGHETAGALALKRYIIDNWSTEQFLGIYECRPVRGGKTPSVHGHGRAIDFHFRTRAELERCFRFLIEHAEALQVQAIHDYDRRTRWEPGKGWYRANIGSAPFAFETHIEVNWQGANDGRSVEEKLGGAPAVPVDSGPSPSPELPPTVESQEDDDVRVLPVLYPPAKFGPRPQAGNRLAHFRHTKDAITGWNGARIGGDLAFPAWDGATSTQSDQAQVEGRTFAAFSLAQRGWIIDGDYIVDIGYYPTGITPEGVPTYDARFLVVYLYRGGVLGTGREIESV